MGTEWADTVPLSKSERLKMALTELALLESLLDGPALTVITLEQHFQEHLRTSGIASPRYTHHARTFAEYVEQAVQLGTLVGTETQFIRLTMIGEFRLNHLRRQRIPSLQ